MHKLIHQIEEKRQAIFVGFFGPIGVSAIFYLYISLEFLETITVDGEQREDAERLGETIIVVVWFLAICSIVSTSTHTKATSSNHPGGPRSLDPSRKTRFLPPQNSLPSFHLTNKRFP